MNKWLVRFWGFVALLGLAGLVASSAWSQQARGETAGHEQEQRGAEHR